GCRVLAPEVALASSRLHLHPAVALREHLDPRPRVEPDEERGLRARPLPEPSTILHQRRPRLGERRDRERAEHHPQTSAIHHPTTPTARLTVDRQNGRGDWI